MFESGAHSSVLEFCLWRRMKGEIYKTNVDTRDELFSGILDATASIEKREDGLRRTTSDLRTCVAECTEVNVVFANIYCNRKNFVTCRFSI